MTDIVADGTLEFLIRANDSNIDVKMFDSYHIPYLYVLALKYDLDNLCNFFYKNSPTNIVQALEFTISSKMFDIATFIMTKYDMNLSTIDPEFMTNAIYDEDADVIIYLVNNEFQVNDNKMKEDMLKIVGKNVIGTNNYDFVNMFKNAYTLKLLGVFKFLFEIIDDNSYKNVLRLLIIEDNVDFFKFMLSEKYLLNTEKIINQAMKYGSVETFKYFYLRQNNDLDKATKYVKLAIKYDQLEITKLIIFDDVEHDHYRHKISINGTVLEAVEHGSKKIFKYYFEKYNFNNYLGRSLVERCIERGYLDMLDHVYENNLELLTNAGINLYHHAIINNSLASLMFLVLKNFTIVDGPNLIKQAESLGFNDIVNYLKNYVKSPDVIININDESDTFTDDFNEKSLTEQYLKSFELDLAQCKKYIFSRYTEQKYLGFFTFEICTYKYATKRAIMVELNNRFSQIFYKITDAECYEAHKFNITDDVIHNEFVIFFDGIQRDTLFINFSNFE